MQEDLAYLDTNIYSGLAHDMDNHLLANLRDRMLYSGLRPALSPVNILEILSTSNLELRNRLVRVCQLVCEPDLLAEPEALLIDFIVSNEKKQETQHLYLPDQFGNSALADTWREVSNDDSRTLLVDEASTSVVDFYRSLHGYLHAFYSRGGRIGELNFPAGSDLNELKSILQSDADHVRSQLPSEPRIAVLCEARALMKQLVLCACVSPFGEITNRYWSSIGIESVAGRYDYANENLGFLDEEGPIIALGTYMGWQATKGLDNGNYLDCFHLMYLPYVRRLYTNDNAFHIFREEYPKAKSLNGLRRGTDLLVDGELG